MSKRGQRGFALLGAVFLLVVLAAAGAMMIRMGGVQQGTTSFAVTGARAYHAARSGIDWALFAADAAPGTCPSSTFNLNEGGVAGFLVEVTCSASNHVEGATTVAVLRFTSTASYQSFGNPDFVSRRLEATATP